MPEALDVSGRATRWSIYWLLIAIGLGGMTGRILAVNAVDKLALEKHLKDQGRDDWRKTRPFLSANDRSRWCTVRALVEHGSYAIDNVIAEPNWDTIDAIKHDGQGNPAPKPGEGHIYSSKPPLLATLIAGPYWLIHKATGATLGTHPYAIGRPLVILFNVVPLGVMFLAVAGLAERLGRTDWGRIFVVAAAVFGTLLTTFAVSLNNHIPGAASAAVALYGLARIWTDGERRLVWFVVTGLAAAFAAASELPALSFTALVGAALLWKAPRETLLAALPGMAIVAAAFFGANYAANGTLEVPYARRGGPDDLYSFQFVKDGKVRDSYWSKPELRSPIDRGEESPAVYAFNALIGHHGILSLTPIWLLSAWGLIELLARREPPARMLAAVVGLASVVCLAFYLSRPLIDRNYGGMTSGLRWAFWFAPLWLAALVPAADRLSRRRWTQAVGLLLLGLSVLSVAYPTWNPWTHPWLMEFAIDQGWAER